MDGFSILILATCVACVAAGVWTLVRGRGRADMLWFAAGSVLTAVWLFAVGSVRVSHTPLVAFGRATVAAALAPVVPFPWFMVTLLLARERGTELLRRHRIPIAATAVLAAVACWAGAYGHLIHAIEQGADGYIVTLTAAGRYTALFMIVACVLSLFNLEATARAASSTTLPGVKHALIGIAAALVYHLFLLSYALLYSTVRQPHLTASAVPILAALLLAGWSAARRRLDESRVAVGRPVFYTSVTAFLAGAYLLLLGVAGWIAREQGWGPSVATSVSLVFAAALLLAVFIFSRRVRRAIRRFIDANFYASRYDYRREWSRTSRALSGVTREVDILERVLDLMSETFEAEPVVGATLEVDSGVVRVHARRGLNSVLAAALADTDLVDALSVRSGPVRVDDATRDPLLREWGERHAAALVAGSYEVAVPLGANGGLIGVALLSRSGGWFGRWTHEDLLLLQMMGRQAGSTLVASRLASDLSATREMESLHRMSSFVVHDLKNSVAGLSMMVRNAEKLIHDPAFQRDLIGSVAETASGIQRVIDRVSGHADATAGGGYVAGGRERDTTRPGHDAQQNGVTCSSPRRGFEDIVAEAARRAGVGAPDCRIRVDVDGCEDTRLGSCAGAVGTVIENLLRNAADAMGGSGTIDVRARNASDGRFVVRVSDTGPGVPSAMVDSGELFAPFRSGSGSGLGVGLYQCRAAIEEIGGGIDLVPDEAGAAFELWVPAGSI